MKSKLILLLVVLSGCFSLAAQQTGEQLVSPPQNTEYFDIKIISRSAILSPKNIIRPWSEMPCNNTYIPEKLDGMLKISYKQYKKIFPELTPEEEDALISTYLTLKFTPDFKMVYFSFDYPVKYLDQLPGLEKRLYQLAHSFEHFDFSPYITILFPDLFKIGSLYWPMRLYIKYDRNPNSEVQFKEGVFNFLPVE